MDAALRKQIVLEWTSGLSPEKKIIVLFEKVRDIPYGDIGSREPGEVHRKNMGTCSGKHELLKELYQELKVPVRDFFAVHRFKDLKVKFPKDIQEILGRSDIVDPHNFLKIQSGNRWLTVDATWDKPMQKMGFHVTEHWDGKSDMPLCVIPIKITEEKFPLEAKKKLVADLPEKIQQDRKLFLKKLSEWAAQNRY